MFTSLWVRFQSWSYRRKLMASYLLLVFVPMLILVSFAAIRNSSMLQAEARQLTSLYTEQACVQIDTRLKEAYGIVRTLVQDEQIIEILQQDPTELSIAEIRKDIKQIDMILNRLTYGSNCYRFRLFVNDAFLYSHRRSSTYGLSDLLEMPWYENLQLLRGGFISGVYPFSYGVLDSQMIVTVYLPISVDFRTVGVFCADILEEDLVSALRDCDYTGQGSAAIVNGEQGFVCGDEEILPLFSDASRSGVFRSGDTLCYLSEPFLNGWRVIACCPASGLEAANSTFTRDLMIFFILLTLAVFLLSGKFSHYNSRRIRLLTEQVQKVVKGDYMAITVVGSGDEIGELQLHFNFLVSRINELLEEQRRLGRSQQELERRILQAQINPHFLYNTLDLITWAARSGDNKRVCDITLALARYYRLSLSRGSDTLTIREEVEHVRLYVCLQSMRFGRISLETRVDPELEDLRIIKLLLQPIVENSILHGIEGSGRDGMIRLYVTSDADWLLITIEDNGVGMSEETIHSLMSRREYSNGALSGSYGIHNICQRLEIYYGKDAGIEFSSREGIGTTVRISLPITVVRESE